MYAGKKYQLPKLIGECQRVLQTNISSDNVCIILDQAILFEEADLINKSVMFIGKNAENVLKSAAFVALSKEGLRQVAAFDWLEIKETALYEACLNWAKFQLKNGPEKKENATDSMIRQALGEVLYRIRFPTMSFIDFATQTGKSDILTCDEKASIYYYIGTKDDVSSALKFDRKTRYMEQTVARYGSTVVQNWGCRSIPDAIQFTCDKDIVLTAVGSFGPNYQYGSIVTSMLTSVDILQITGGYNIYGQQATIRIGGRAEFTADYSNFTTADQILKISMDAQIEIKANTAYIVKLSIQQGGYRSCYRAYGQSGQTRVLTSQSVSFTFSAAQIPEGSQTTVDSGQIPLLYFIG